jgi:nucleoside-diphosphate-sugar epimerase|tara:strand:+ start:2901 stop:3764 length:864 start_codon:yes stop_codon:yes gene_type:complete
VKKVLVTGGAGSMGRLVTNQLISMGYFVKIFDLPSANFEGFDTNLSEIIKGDLNSLNDISNSIKDVDSVIHLAAILPPTANIKIDLANKVNVDGTKNLVKCIESSELNIHLIFSSSVSIYGKNINKIVDIQTEPNPDDHYALTKYQSEKIVTNSKINFTVLRISGVSIPIFQEPPSAWPFKINQKIEFIHRDDVVDSLCNCVNNREAYKEIFNISGGKTWQMLGKKYVEDYFKILEVDNEAANYQELDGHFSWYDSTKSNRILKYQNKNYKKYLSEIEDDLERLMGV